MTNSNAGTCAEPCTDLRACECKGKRPVTEWSRTDLDIQTFVRLASGGIDAGFDRLMTR